MNRKKVFFYCFFLGIISVIFLGYRFWFVKDQNQMGIDKKIHDVRSRMWSSQRKINESSLEKLNKFKNKKPLKAKEKFEEINGKKYRKIKKIYSTSPRKMVITYKNDDGKIISYTIADGPSAIVVSLEPDEEGFVRVTRIGTDNFNLLEYFNTDGQMTSMEAEWTRSDIMTRISKEWYTNGNLKKVEKSEMENQRKTGKLKRWYEDGCKMVKLQISNGVYKKGKSWDREGIVNGRIKDGEGEIIERHEPTNRNVKLTFENGEVTNIVMKN